MIRMNTQEKLDVIKMRVETINARDWDSWETLHLETAIRTAPELVEPSVGTKGMRIALETLVEAFPDYQLSIRNAFGEWDWLCAELTATGTHTGPLNMAFQTFRPTYRSFESNFCSVFSFKGTKIASVWEYYDLLGLIGQLGIGREI